MRHARGWFVSLIVGVVLGVAGPAWATMDNFKSFKAAYPGKLATCQTCHNGLVGKKGDLNAYGTALQEAKTKAAAADAKKLTEPDYRAVESGDADGDGVSNLAEITAGTNPGVAAATPNKGGAK